MAPSEHIPIYVQFTFASVSGIIATFVTYPLELIKIRMQLYGEKKRLSTREVAQRVYRIEGHCGFYRGVTSSLVRQVFYTGTRMCCYTSLLEYYSSKNGVNPPLYVKSLIGIVSGTVGGILGLPSDMIMVRKAGDATFPPEKRRNYTGFGNAVRRIIQEEGFKALFTGFTPTVARSTILNVSQLVSYSQAKDFFLTYEIMDDNAYCHTGSSIFSALCASISTLPSDVAKTRLQNMTHVNGKPQYSGLIDVWVKTVRYEGFSALFKGFTPLFMRNMPQFLIFFLLYEQFVSIYKRFDTT